MAGVVGYDVGRLTLRELVRQHEGRLTATWCQTAHLLAAIHNANVTDESRLREPIDFLPDWLKRKVAPAETTSPPPSESDLVFLRQVFPGDRKQKGT